MGVARRRGTPLPPNAEACLSMAYVGEEGVRGDDLRRLLAINTPSGLVNATFLALMGAGFAAGTLALARKAEDRELPEAGADVAEVGLTQEERRELLGR